MPEVNEFITETKIITLKDGTIATLYPIYLEKLYAYPDSLIEYLFRQFNDEIFRGDTYPHLQASTKQEFVDYWFGSFHGLLIKGDHVEMSENSNWNELWLGSFYIRPNYHFGRCSHICNGAFLVNPLKRGLGIGKELGINYLKWAPKLGYTYSMFNLVFATNPASWKTWDSLGFERIGLIPEAGVLKGHDKKVDAIIFGKKLV